MAEENKATSPATSKDDVEKNKGLAIIAYFGPLFIVPYLAAKDSNFAKYHANQGLNLFLAYVAVSFVMFILPVIGWFFAWIAYVVLFVFFVMGVVNAANGQMKPLPLIGSLELLK